MKMLHPIIVTGMWVVTHVEKYMLIFERGLQK